MGGSQSKRGKRDSRRDGNPRRAQLPSLRLLVDTPRKRTVARQMRQVPFPILEHPGFACEAAAIKGHEDVGTLGRANVEAGCALGRAAGRVGRVLFAGVDQVTAGHL